MLGLNQSLMSVSQIVGPALAGALIGRHLLTEWAFVAAVVMLAGGVSSFSALRARHAA